jgi:hypothetical protein
MRAEHYAMWKQFPGTPHNQKDIKALATAAKTPLKADAAKASDPLKQKCGLLQQLRAT